MLAPNPALPVSVFYHRLFYQRWEIRLLLFFFHSPHCCCQQSWTLPHSTVFLVSTTHSHHHANVDYLPRGPRGLSLFHFHFITKLYEKGSMSANTISALSFLCTGSFFFSLVSKNQLFVLIFLCECKARLLSATSASLMYADHSELLNFEDLM